MSRTTRALLQGKVNRLNVLLGLPTDVVERDSKGQIIRDANGHPITTNGCITLDYNQPGGNRYTWAVVINHSNTSQTVLNRHQYRMTPDECNAFLSGMLAVLEDVPVYRK